MIRISMEIPTAYLKAWSPLCDADFALAHRVLEDEAYADYYAQRPRGRECVMDNSMHELGKPLSLRDLGRAAERINADLIIAPDQLGQVEFNRSQFRLTLRALGEDFRIGAVMCGHTPSERSEYLKDVSSADVLLLPYREPRLTWFLEQEEFITQNWNQIHLLGVNELEELRVFRCISNRLPDMSWSVDTAKPVKWGRDERLIDNISSLRANGLKSKDLLDLSDLSEAQFDCVVRNVQILRESCA